MALPRSNDKDSQIESNYLDVVAGHIRHEVSGRSVPDRPETVPLFRSYAVLLLARGQDVTGRDVHNAWVAWMLEVDPEHAALVPYEELSDEVAQRDDEYVAAIHRAAARLSRTSPAQ